ncbi:MAG: flavodoxin family protein [Deltaproteobacteria bacterium]|nr:flavodoxin family protein [Deltaproteobacteria bacterium]
MKTLVISGSRNPQGRTASLIKALCRGITTAGSDSEVLYLPQMNIELCRQCNDDGWGICRDETKCIIDDDDFTRVVEKIDDADAVVFANPVYFGDLSESMKAFLDRFRRVRTTIPRVPLPTSAPPPGPFNNESGPIAVGICYAGGSGNGTTSCCMNLERTLQICGFDVVDMIPVRRQNLDAKIKIMELTGLWLATQPASSKCKLEPI